MAKHSPRFLRLAEEAKARIQETTVDAVKAKMDDDEPINLIDVREESEYAKDHLPGAIHLGKGIIERDIESQFPDPNVQLILYCGGGYRSALATEALMRMGYRNAISMDGGIRGWREAGFPLERG